ncbi:hypothetical protein Zmor_001477 [Zophobas morio]|uniref:RNA-directed DNA polymerase n=1 Tax=Zophobas morio TaxID=2755281 RepID=A0AA38J3T2_9CUCU|nr:hypothetical protein Zmor_001477 [Zophobas morio]
MPRINDILHTAKHTPFMSTIDLQAGYWQVPIAEEDRGKTCFVTPLRTFKFNRIPVGLRNAPATFVRLMDRFRSGLNDTAVFVYIDDILVLSAIFEKHIIDLQTVFSGLKLFGLRARREKCSFFSNSVKFLGHILTSDGIKTNSDKIAAIKLLRPPSNRKRLQSFIQTCSWYRKFVSEFSEIAHPLSNLLKKNASFQFGEAELRAFETLKERLTTAPVLAQADQTKPYILRTDASCYALGAVLL